MKKPSVSSSQKRAIKNYRGRLSDRGMARFEEISRGVLQKPAGSGRDRLEAWFSGLEGPQALFAGRVLPFDEKAALVWARLMAEGKSRGRPHSGLDTIIAAVAEANDCVVVTGNERDFVGVEIVNPLQTE